MNTEKQLSAFTLDELFTFYRLASNVYRLAMADAGIFSKDAAPVASVNIARNLARANAEWTAASIEIMNRRRSMGYPEGVFWTVSSFQADLAAVA